MASQMSISKPTYSSPCLNSNGTNAVSTATNNSFAATVVEHNAAVATAVAVKNFFKYVFICVSFGLTPRCNYFCMLRLLVNIKCMTSRVQAICHNQGFSLATIAHARLLGIAAGGRRQARRYGRQA